MAARNRPGLSENTRQRIKTTMITKRLMDHILASEGDPAYEMKQTQITAALGLLKKTLPDLQATQISGDDNSPLSVQLMRYADSKTAE